MSKTISAGRTPKIVIDTIGGDLSLVGWESDEVLIKGDEDQLRIDQNGEEVEISADDDLSVRIPKGASVQIERIRGDASIRGVSGGVHLSEIEGDLSIRDVGPISIGSIHADFSLRGARGDLNVRNAHSDVSIREVDGNISLESIASDLALRDVRGNVHANVSEDVVLYLIPKPGNDYSITAGEDILLVMPPSANATCTLKADRIVVDWKGVEKDADATSRIITLGEGSAAISLTAGGDIRVSNQSDAGESAEEFGNFAAMGFDWSDFGERISRQVERVTRKATRRAEDLARRMERRGPQVNVGYGRWHWDPSARGVPMPPKPRVSDEERLAILKMLQEKKITADEADALLAALEGEG